VSRHGERCRRLAVARRHGLLEQRVGLGHGTPLRQGFGAAGHSGCGSARHAYSGAGAEPANSAATSPRISCSRL
jgi:hypothetical protein